MTSKDDFTRILSPNDEYNDVIVCHKCKELAYEPTNCPTCSKIFCMECLLDQEDKRCPCCFDKIDIDALKPSMVAKTLLDSLQARCINIGCEFRGTFADVTHHLHECEYGDVDCSTCGGTMPRSNLENHTLTCDKRSVRCLRFDIGCPWRGNRESQSEHESKCLFIKLGPAFDMLRTENKQLRKQVAKLSDALEKKIEPSISKVRDDVMEIFIRDHGYLWKIPKNDFFYKKFDEALVSEQFALMGQNWVLEAYPCGAQYLGYAGIPCVFLRYNGSGGPLHAKSLFFIDHPLSSDKRISKERSYLQESGKGYGGKLDDGLRLDSMTDYIFDDECIHIGVVIKGVSIE